MFNSINSYSNSYTSYNNTNNNSLALKNENLNKTINSSNNKIENSTQVSLNKNLVKDKSKAASEVLGYGVDNEGFFTSDLNEAAGIPKSFKIHAKQVKSFYDTYTSTMPTHNSIDIAKTLANAYKAFENDIGINLKQSYSQDELTKLSATNKHLSDKLSSINALQKALDENGTSASGISWGTFFDLSLYTQNERIDKTSLFALYINSDFIEGEVNMYGKIMGFDKTMSKAEVEDLQNFIDNNKILGLLGLGANPSGFESVMRSSDLSIDEFKEKWLEYKEKAQSEFKLKDISEEIKNNEQDDESKKTFTPIQATSKNEIYKDTGYFKFKDLLKNQQDLDTLSILFESIKNNDKNKNFMNLLNGVDIKA